MSIVETIRAPIADYLWLRTLRRHKSRLGRKSAPQFSAYLEQCQKHAPVDASSDARIRAAAESFRARGVAHVQTAHSQELAQSMLQRIEEEERIGSIWDEGGRYVGGAIFEKFEEIENILRGDAGDFIRSIYGTHFKVFFGVLYRSVRDSNEPVGSQVWHADGGPGTCINLMYCLSSVSAGNGSMECLPWPESVNIYARERATLRMEDSHQAGDKRDARAAYYKKEIEQRFGESIVQPESGPGLLYAFRNNCIHKGGFVQPGEERYVIVFHVYPSMEPTPFEKYRSEGIGKRAANPDDPAF